MKILITGANGLLGQKLVYALIDQGKHTLVATARGANRALRREGYTYVTLDLADAAAIADVIKSYRPEVLIHTAAMTNVDACELDPEACRIHNVEATRHLLEACKPIGTHFIFVSTDFVFNGKEGPYREEDTVDPLSVYARSKAEAEILVQQSGLPWSILRTMIIYGVVDDAQRSNVVLWTKSSLEEGKDIHVISDQYRGPTLAEDLAQACISCAEKKATGLYHVSGREVMSILDIAREVADFFHLDKRHLKPITTAALKQPALRPLRTGFIIDKAERELDFRPHSLKEGLGVVQAQLQKKSGTR